MAVVDAAIQGVPEQAHRRRQTISHKYSSNRKVYTALYFLIFLFIGVFLLIIIIITITSKSNTQFSTKIERS